MAMPRLATSDLPDAAAIHAGLAERLEQHRAQTDRDPHANPIQLLAESLLEDMLEGQIDRQAVEDLVQRLTRIAFNERARRVRAYLGELDAGQNRERIGALIRQAATDADGALIPFEAFRKIVERRHFGLVFTAHPTFSLKRQLQDVLISLAVQQRADGTPLDKADREKLLDEAERSTHRPEPIINLAEEHRQSLNAIANIRAALAMLYETIYETTRELYPDNWRELKPWLVSVATWVGYDTDGRADITWAMTLSKRIITQRNQLAYYQDKTSQLRATLDDRHPLASHLELIQARLALASKALDDELAVFGAFDSNAPGSDQAVASISRTMVAGLASRLTDGRALGQLVDRALELADDETSIRALWVMRAEIGTSGLTAARSHLRINAIQLHNAIRKAIAMDHAADDPIYHLSYIAAITEKIERARPETINFGSLLNERATAKRAFMLMRQMLTFLDSSEPLRFLIAECETPLTLLAALYFAKQFGIDDKIDISPLFETSTAIERGTELMRGAIRVPAYRAYLERRGRVCIQTGFSDAGRYIGQIAASDAIERVRIGMRDLLVEEGLTHLELVIFDTHGESIGRGAHPAGLSDRFRYYDTAYARTRFDEAGIRIVEETSFQGGDGYTHFLRRDSALAVLTRIVEHILGERSEGADPFYEDDDYGREFFAAIRQFNYRAIANPDYATFLGAYGVNMLYPTGSRALKRQHDRGIGNIDLEHPSQLRAIPHNSILQQLGILANTIGGVGQAVDKNPRRFQELYRESPRFRRLMMMVEYAFMYTDLDVVRAYLELFDAGRWLRQAQLEKRPACEEELRLVAGFVEGLNKHDALMRIYRVFLRDYIELARALREHRRLTRHEGGEPIAIDSEIRDNIHMLHALRIALIKALMRRAVHVPDFSDRLHSTHDEIVANIMRLDVEAALALLRQVFPMSERDAALDFGETATYEAGNGQSYAEEHRTIFAPIEHHYEMIRRISTGIVHHIGALG